MRCATDYVYTNVVSLIKKMHLIQWHYAYIYKSISLTQCKKRNLKEYFCFFASRLLVNTHTGFLFLHFP